jgi:hypothetical protein
VTSIWDQYPDLPDPELRTLVAAAAQVLLDGTDRAGLPEDALEMSNGTAARELATTVPGLDGIPAADVRAVLEDDAAAAALGRAVLDQVRAHPELADAVAAAYEERTRKMTGVELVLLSGALVVLATRIKEIKVGGGQTKITFAESGDVVKAFLTGLVGTFRGV